MREDFRAFRGRRRWREWEREQNAAALASLLEI